MTARKKGVFAAVKAELDTLGKADTPAGAACLVLAQRLDLNADPGSAMAAMAKELRATMMELSRSAPAAADPIDELRTRRERRLSG